MSDSFEDDKYVMIPFVLTEAQGGEYDTEAFGAGWTLGILDARLALADTTDLIVPPVVLKTKWRKQADLIAMSHSLLVKMIPIAEKPEYSYFIFGTPEFFKGEDV